MRGEKGGCKKMFGIFWKNVLRSTFLGRRKWGGPRDATLPPRMQRYPSSTPTTKPRVVFIKMLNPPSSLSAAEEVNSTILPSLSHPPSHSRVTPARISISFESCAHDIDSPAGWEKGRRGEGRRKDIRGSGRRPERVGNEKASRSLATRLDRGIPHFSARDPPGSL